MIRIVCPVERCNTLELPDDIDQTEIAAIMCDHLQHDGFYGESMIDRLAAVRVDSDHTHVRDLRRYIDRPLIALGTDNKQHAIGPGWVSTDGRGPAVCNSGITTTIVPSLDGGTLKATARKEPGTVQPQCVACRRRLP